MQSPRDHLTIARSPRDLHAISISARSPRNLRLSRVFQMYDLEGRGHLSEDRLRLVLADMGLDPENDPSERAAIDSLLSSLRAAGATNVDPTDHSLRIPAFEFLRIMQAQEFIQGEAGRYWVALSLREAESLRGAMHVAIDGQVPHSALTARARFLI